MHNLWLSHKEVLKLHDNCKHLSKSPPTADLFMKFLPIYYPFVAPRSSEMKTSWHCYVPSAVSLRIMQRSCWLRLATDCPVEHSPQISLRAVLSHKEQGDRGTLCASPTLFFNFHFFCMFGIWQPACGKNAWWHVAPFSQTHILPRKQKAMHAWNNVKSCAVYRIVASQRNKTPTARFPVYNRSGRGL